MREGGGEENGGRDEVFKMMYLYRGSGERDESNRSFIHRRRQAGGLCVAFARRRLYCRGKGRVKVGVTAGRAKSRD